MRHARLPARAAAPSPRPTPSARDEVDAERPQIVRAPAASQLALAAPSEAAAPTACCRRPCRRWPASFDARRRRLRRRAQVPAADDAGVPAAATTRAAGTRRRCAWSSTRCSQDGARRHVRPARRRLPPLHRRRRTGWCRTSRRCSTTTRCWPASTCTPARSPATPFYRRVAEETLDYVLREMTARAAASTPRWTPTARARRASSTSGRRPRRSRCSATRRCAAVRALLRRDAERQLRGQEHPALAARHRRSRQRARHRLPRAARRPLERGRRRAARRARAAGPSRPRREGADRLERADAARVRRGGGACSTRRTTAPPPSATPSSCCASCGGTAGCSAPTRTAQSKLNGYLEDYAFLAEACWRCTRRRSSRAGSAEARALAETDARAVLGRGEGVLLRHRRRPRGADRPPARHSSTTPRRPATRSPADVLLRLGAHRRGALRGSAETRAAIAAAGRPRSTRRLRPPAVRLRPVLRSRAGDCAGRPARFAGDRPFRQASGRATCPTRSSPRRAGPSTPPRPAGPSRCSKAATPWTATPPPTCAATSPANCRHRPSTDSER